MVTPGQKRSTRAAPEAESRAEKNGSSPAVSFASLPTPPPEARVSDCQGPGLGPSGPPNPRCTTPNDTDNAAGSGHGNF